MAAPVSTAPASTAPSSALDAKESRVGYEKEKEKEKETLSSTFTWTFTTNLDIKLKASVNLSIGTHQTNGAIVLQFADDRVADEFQEQVAASIDEKTSFSKWSFDKARGYGIDLKECLNMGDCIIARVMVKDCEFTMGDAWLASTDVKTGFIKLLKSVNIPRQCLYYRPNFTGTSPSPDHLTKTQDKKQVKKTKLLCCTYELRLSAASAASGSSDIGYEFISLSSSPVMTTKIKLDNQAVATSFMAQAQYAMHNSTHFVVFDFNTAENTFGINVTADDRKKSTCILVSAYVHLPHGKQSQLGMIFSYGPVWFATLGNEGTFITLFSLAKTFAN